jgi:hypothetical protein
MLAADTSEGIDPRLASIAGKLQGLFSYSTIRLVAHQDQTTVVGKPVAFMLPGGRILNVQPRSIDGDMISMELILFQGARPMMTTDLKLRNRRELFVGGPRYNEGVLIISIGATMADPRTVRHTAPPNADASAQP